MTRGQNLLPQDLEAPRAPLGLRTRMWSLTQSCSPQQQSGRSKCPAAPEEGAALESRVQSTLLPQGFRRKTAKACFSCDETDFP